MNPSIEVYTEASHTLYAAKIDRAVAAGEKMDPNEEALNSAALYSPIVSARIDETGILYLSLVMNLDEAPEGEYEKAHQPLSEIKMAFSRAEWEAFKAYVDATWREH